MASEIDWGAAAMANFSGGVVMYDSGAERGKERFGCQR